jgi:hypothetical protein
LKREVMANLDTHLDRYRYHLRLSRDWLVHSIDPVGGSRAHFSPLVGWSRAYPETSGYIATSLLDIDDWIGDGQSAAAAIRIGRWLASIQEPEGCWKGGLYPYANAAIPSVFNTGQILNGLTSLARRGHDEFSASAERAARWLANGVGPDGTWASGHYRAHQPDYYSFVAWPMLDYAHFVGDAALRDTASRVVRRILENQQPNTAFAYWGFDPAKPAFTHTIAYTLQGLIESARFLPEHEMAIMNAVAPALERLRRQAELTNGKLQGSFDARWKANATFECLTGAAQVAICLLLVHRRKPDLRLVNAAAKLVDRVCTLQGRGPLPALKGAVAGSNPLWGPYMRFRYPNWAVKFHADALMLLSESLSAAHANH